MGQERDIPAIAATLREMQDTLKEQNELIKKLVGAQNPRRTDGEVTPPGGGDPGPSQGQVSAQESDEKGERKGLEPQAKQEGDMVWSDDEIQTLPWKQPINGVNMEYYNSEEDVENHIGMEGPVARHVIARDSEPENGVIGERWRYWGQAQLFKDSSGHILYQRWSETFKPYYIPPWELREHEDKWYHIDDIEMCEPLAITRSKFRELEWHKVGQLVPYSFMPPLAKNRFQRPTMARTGLTVSARELQQSLGDLYSVPSDARIPLAFERNDLRLKCASGEIWEYLKETQKFFKDLSQANGFFLVQDFDEGYDSVTYKWGGHRSEHDDGIIPETKHRYWMAAQPALLAERNKVRIAPGFVPTIVHLESRDGLDQEIREDYVGFYRLWYRVIHFHGLATLIGSRNIKGNNRSEEAKKLWGLLIGSAQNNHGTSPDFPSGIVETFDLHLFCSRTRGTTNPFLTGYKSFHITWYEIRDIDREDKVGPSTWNIGKLYGSDGRKQIQETAFTVGYYPQSSWWNMKNFPDYDWGNTMVDLVKNGYCFWTILLLTPPHLDCITQNLHYRPSFLLDMIECGLGRCADSWAAIGTHFSVILDDQTAILNPVIHDELLFDDDTFSRSRQYFWAVDSLVAFRTQIADTIQEWDNFWAARGENILKFEVAHRSRCEYMVKKGDDRYPPPYSVKESLRKVHVQITRLKDQDAQFEAFFKKTLALREGLFNASSVIESRAATRLGENVKLLTYVSIFYLPLTFCAGLWSINNAYSIPHFIITTTVIAFTNYLLVANLEVVVTACSSVYRSVRIPVIGRMREAAEKKWSERGIAFSSFKPERKKVEPSEWYIPWFVVVKFLRKLGFFKLEKSTDSIPPEGGGAQEVATEENTNVQEEAEVPVVDKGKNVIRGSTSNEGKESKTKEFTSNSVFELKSEATTCQPPSGSGLHFKQWFEKETRSARWKRGSGDPEKGQQM